MDWTPPNSKYPPPKPGEPLLFRAAREGDHAAMRRAVAKSDINAEFDIGLDPGACEWPVTALMVAAGSGDGASVETVALLLSLGADPKRVTRAGSAAEFACRGLGWNYRPGGDAERLELLLAIGSPLPSAEERRARLIADAARAGDPGRLAVLLKFGLSANPVFSDELAAQRREQTMEFFKSVSGSCPACDVSDMDLDDMTSSIRGELAESFAESAASGPSGYEIPLFCAAESGNAECVRMLIKAGANVGVRDCSIETALMQALSTEAAAVLLEYGASMHDVDDSGRDVLGHVVHREAEDVAPSFMVSRLLLARGAPLLWRAENRWTRLERAAFDEQLAAVQFLLEAGHSAAGRAGERTALHAICWHWDYGDERDEQTRGIVKALLAAGIDPNARDEQGNTPLHEAVAGDGANVVAMEELFAAAADPNIRNGDGLTPLAFLYETHFEYAKVVPVLLRHGANPLIADSKGRTAIDLARARARGDDPDWRNEQWSGDGGPPCGWKAPSTPGDEEDEVVRLLVDAAARFA